MFTGKYPLEHGSHSYNKGKETPWFNVWPLSQDQLTLAEVLNKEGYQTGAFVANAAYLNEKFQLNQGFDTYYVKNIKAKSLNKQIYKWLEERADTPFFLFINYIDVHSPYNTASRSFFEKLYRKFRCLIGKPSALDRSELLKKLNDEVLPNKGPVPKNLADLVIKQYDRSIENVDDGVGELLDKLKEMGLYDDTIIVLTADHGEYFGEHHLVVHCKDVFQEALRVPLIIKSRFQNNSRIDDTIVSSPDIPQLIFSQLPNNIAEQYSPFFPYRPGNHLVISENYYTRTRDLLRPDWGKRFDRIRTAAFNWPFKYIHSSDGRHELYNLLDDPKEKNDIIKEQAEIAEKISSDLKQFRQNARIEFHEKKEVKNFNAEDLEVFRSLGYID